MDYGVGSNPGEIPRDLYEDKGYQPSFERLPSKEEYQRSYEIGFAPKGSHKVTVGRVPTAKKALEEIEALRRSDEEIRYIQAPGGRMIETYDLEELAKGEKPHA